MFAPDTWDANRLKASAGRSARAKALQGRSPHGNGLPGSARDTSPDKPSAVGVGQDLETSFPEVRSARTVPAAFHDGLRARRAEVGYLRIWSFDVHDHEAFVTEVDRLLRQLPRDRLIVDVRGNPGKLIWAAERLLQLFTDKEGRP